MPIRTLALALLTVAALACGRGDAPPAAEVDVPVAKAAEAPAAKPEAPARPRGRPLPAFTGWTLDDKHVDAATLIGRRLLLLFFNPGVAEAAAIAEAAQAIAPLRGPNNFEIVGVATGSSRAEATAFAHAKGLSYRVVDDSTGALAQRFALQSPAAVLLTDAEGYLTFGAAGFGTADVAVIENLLRRALRLPPSGPPEELHPAAPTFTARPMEGTKPFVLAEHRDRPVVLIFFLHTCPHCHAALLSLKDDLAQLPADARPLLVGIEITGKTYEVKETLHRDGLDFFPVYFDDDGKIQASYRVYAGVPDIFLIDRTGKIAARMQGWTPERDAPLLRMRLAQLVGAPVPMLLASNGYSGSEVCGVCHPTEYETWSFTPHAGAFDTLVKHGSDTDPECIGCHVVGWKQPGGFRSAAETAVLEDVGCEDCHGRGGPHLSPDFVKGGNYEPACLGCHDVKHSLGFAYASFLPRISHQANAHLLALSSGEKQRLLAERGHLRGGVLPQNANVVGSDACRSCHPAEFETWASSRHARAAASLEAKQHPRDADCQRCHTTGLGRPGGFPAGAPLSEHPDLARVGCEDCHGPGGEHVKSAKPPAGSILSLGDKCDSCVILQICGRCHDDANDPGFEFAVQRKIDAQRHGTIEAGTGKPKAKGAGAPAADAPLVAGALPALDASR